jgi:hypothetical protein
MRSLVSRGFVLSTVAYRNRDNNRDLQCGTVSETVSGKVQGRRHCPSPHSPGQQYAFSSKHSYDAA